jgi:small subunit ribosomal protein S15
MPVYLPKEKRDEIFTKYSGSATNTGDTKGQIALFTFRINELSAHLRANKNDHSSRRRLLTLVGKRRGLLTYLQKKDLMGYRELIADLGIRR